MTPKSVGCMEPVGILKGCAKNVRMAIATASATSNTSTFSRMPALGYGLSHLFAVFSRSVIPFFNCSSAALSRTAAATAPMEVSMAVIACGERMSLCALSNLRTCLHMSDAWRAVLDLNHLEAMRGESIYYVKSLQGYKVTTTLINEPLNPCNASTIKQRKEHHAFNTSINASCGMLTEPKAFMRFLPSFCFSRSLRLRVMSPP